MFLLKENQTPCFFEVYLAREMVLRFIKAQVLGVPCFQQLVPIKSAPLLVAAGVPGGGRTAEFKEGSVPPG